MMERVSDQAGPLHGGQEHPVGSKPFHDAAAA